MPASHYFSAGDWVIIAVYLLGIIALGVWFGKDQHTTRDYFLGSRNIPWWGMAAQRWGLITVRRADGAKALRAMVIEARERTAQGRPLAIFPEGTRTPFGQSGELQSGFAALYKLLGFPVVPVALTSGALYHHWIKRPGTIVYRFCEPIPPGLKREEIEARVGEAVTAFNREG